MSYKYSTFASRNKEDEKYLQMSLRVQYHNRELNKEEFYGQDNIELSVNPSLLHIAKGFYSWRNVAHTQNAAYLEPQYTLPQNHH